MAKPTYTYNVTLIPEAALARELGISAKTLRSWRLAGDAPDHMVMKGRIYYVRGQVDAWVLKRSSNEH